MKIGAALILLLFLSGCSESHTAMETGMELRSKVLQATSCTFRTEVTADYGDKIHIFSMDCQTDSDGNLRFTIAAPDTISGITGNLSDDGGRITFDDTALCFELIAEGQLSPISAPWIFFQTLRSGNVTSACTEGDKVRLSVDDSYEEDPLRLDIWLNSESKPEQADILYKGKRILSVAVDNFEIL